MNKSAKDDRFFPQSAWVQELGEAGNQRQVEQCY
jgi:hypothetical protein